MPKIIISRCWFWWLITDWHPHTIHLALGPIEYGPVVRAQSIYLYIYVWTCVGRHTRARWVVLIRLHISLDLSWAFTHSCCRSPPPSSRFRSSLRRTNRWNKPSRRCCACHGTLPGRSSWDGTSSGHRSKTGRHARRCRGPSSSRTWWRGFLRVPNK